MELTKLLVRQETYMVSVYFKEEMPEHEAFWSWLSSSTLFISRYLA